MVSPGVEQIRHTQASHGQTLSVALDIFGPKSLKLIDGVACLLGVQGYTSILVGEAIIRGSESQMAGSSYQGGYNEGKGLMIAYRSKGSLKYRGSGSAFWVLVAGF